MVYCSEDSEDCHDADLEAVLSSREGIVTSRPTFTAVLVTIMATATTILIIAKNLFVAMTSHVAVKISLSVAVRAKSVSIV